MLEIKNLNVEVDGKEILKGLNLSVAGGELHAIMGRNGSGKSTLANVIAGREKYHITSGEILYDGQDLSEMSTEERALAGIFLSFQYPVAIPGVNNTYFLKAAVNVLRKHRGEEEMDAMDFLTFIKKKMKVVEMDESFLRRAVNDGFSGGEKKRNEILQMAVLEPKLALLDETDSGLDIYALRIVSDGVNLLRTPENAVVLVTHYQRILNYITPNQVHVLFDGRIVRSGGPELAHELEEKGYDWIKEAVDAGV